MASPGKQLDSQGRCQREAGGGGLPARTCVFTSAYWLRKTTSDEVGGLGWSSWAAAGLPGKYSLSVLLFCLFSIFITLF